jgi:RHS repeat-associated protein
LILIIKNNRQLGNHLGNVLTTISDKKIGVYSGGSLTLPDGSTAQAVGYYNPDIISANDYFPFGMLSRLSVTTTGVSYKYGFNGKENDWEAKGWQNQVDYDKRIYDPRLGRFLSIDPLTQEYPWYTPYQFAGNKLIWAIDRDGEEEWFYYKKDLVTSGWTKSKLFSGPWTEEYGNSLGYLSAQQVHKKMLLQKGEDEFEAREARIAE